jgi:hypothetical protein
MSSSTNRLRFSLFTLLVAHVAVATADVSQPATEDPRKDDAIQAIVFLDSRDDAPAVESQLAEMLARAATDVGATVESSSRPLVEVLRAGGAASEDGRDAVRIRVLLPAGVSKDAFLQALSRDETCRASAQSCRTHCRLLAQLATGGHWHLQSAVAGRQCLAIFAPSAADATELRRHVLRRPLDLGLPRKPRVGRVLITLGRPDHGDPGHASPSNPVRENAP